MICLTSECCDKWDEDKIFYTTPVAKYPYLTKSWVELVEHEVYYVVADSKNNMVKQLTEDDYSDANCHSHIVSIIGNIYGKK